MILHALTTFLGSFLLFQVQPLVGRFILPWFGGTPAVWTTCMLFFQTLLLGGYAYAHGATLLPRRHQPWVHGALLLLALFFLPVAPDPELWKPSPEDPPVRSILFLLTATVGMPYLVLSASAPLVQHWFTRDFPGRSPYWLYALSNAGSLLALLSYPFVVEPILALRLQSTLWSWGFALYAALCAVCAAWPLLARRKEEAVSIEMAPPGALRNSLPLARADLLLWVALSACGSALLLATTNQLCQEVAVVPFLWIAPLALYLLTFILCFRTERGYDRILWGLLFAAAVFFACRTLALGTNATLPAQVLVFLGALFVGCLVCHGELVRSRPDPTHLTTFYLSMAAGGALGGVFIGLAAPALFTGLWEYPLSWCLTAVVVLVAWFRGGVFRSARWLAPTALVALAALIVFTAGHLRKWSPYSIWAERNFYGVLRVTRFEVAAGNGFSLLHGRTMHGMQFSDPDKRATPTTYFTPESGVGLALRHHPRNGGPLRVGVVGLGAGTLAAYGRKGDTFRFYEINPAVITVARERFFFLKNSPARIGTVAGDARIVMERELAGGSAGDYDLLVVDAFSSDAIPVHLLTRECFDLYRRRLRPDGMLAIHITNRFLDLVPLVRAQGEGAKFRVGLISSEGDESAGRNRSDWMILSRDGRFLGSEGVRDRLKPLPPPASRPWTDDYASLWPLLKR